MAARRRLLVDTNEKLLNIQGNTKKPTNTCVLFADVRKKKL